MSGRDVWLLNVLLKSTGSHTQNLLTPSISLKTKGGKCFSLTNCGLV